MKNRHFSEKEFKMGSENVYDKMDKRLLTLLEALRELLGKPLKINSSYRTKEYCKANNIAYIKTSYHLKGKAVDLSTRNLTPSERYALIELSFKLGFGGIGVYDTFVHLDTRTKKSLWAG